MLGEINHQSDIASPSTKDQPQTSTTFLDSETDL